jgi:hypothetical protein
VAYRRVWEQNGDYDSAIVFLNFGRHSVDVDMASERGKRLFSNRRADIAPFSGAYTLAAYEGVVVLA